MKRRDFFRNGSLVTLGSFLTGFHPDTFINHKDNFKNKKAKNIIFMVSDGMSTGTLNMADRLLQLKNGSGSHWLDLYRDGKINRSLMDTASEDSLVTDSAAASSSWGGGQRVPNGSLNISSNGKENMPILQKFKAAGKRVGCVTTVPITHATPAGFCVMQKDRGDQDSIAEKYAELQFDVMMGGGSRHFDPARRKDGKDLYSTFKANDYVVLTSRSDVKNYTGTKKVLGLFADEALPYALDRDHDSRLKNNTPSLSEMTNLALKHLSKDNPEGFVLQIEAGKVDWAAHANDAGALIYDQIAFDDTIKEVTAFADNDQETLVIITTDHGNANPGLIKSKDVDKNFSHLLDYTHTNEWILKQLNQDSSASKIREVIASANGGQTIDPDQSREMVNHYNQSNGGLYNTDNLPFAAISRMQKNYTSIGWISMDHSGDYVELAAYGPGSEELNPFIRNYELHDFLLKAAEVENRF